MIAPKEAQFYHEGLYYKKGVHGFVFMWVGEKWTRSTKQWSTIIKGRAV